MPGGDEASAAAHGSVFRITDLPIETQREILSHCSQSDLICAALVSKHFHDLASSILYRDFHIIFPDDDDLSFDSPVDGLAGGLDTFTTSDYDYGRHLRDLSMDTLSSGPKGERSYQPYLYSSSCGKFFNTLLYLTLKKAHSLEAFRWNVRIELSRPVYRQLRQLKSLKSLHIRMQAGDSYYSRPPPLPISFHQHSPPSPVYGHSHWTNASFLPVQSAMAAPHPISHHPSQAPPHARSRSVSKNRVSKQTQEASRLSGFKNLKSLSVLDIDDKNLVSEIADSVKSSYSSLTELQLSLSRALASRARKASHESDAEESTDEDYPGSPNAPAPAFGSAEPVRAFRAQEEWKKQETLLARILGVEPSLHKKPQMNLDPNPSKSDDVENDMPAPTDPGEVFITSLRGVSSKLLALLNGSREITASHQEIMDTLEQAARKYVESGHLASLKQSQEARPQNEDPEQESADVASNGNIFLEPLSTDSETIPQPTAVLPVRQKWDRVPWADVNVEYIEDASPNAGDAVESRNSTNLHDTLSSPEPSSSRSNQHLTVASLPRCHSNDKLPTEEDFGRRGRSGSENSIYDYIRSTRGISLEVLKIDLLPVKASVLCRALNLSALKEITLLNVGSQAPIWTALARENTTQPLAVRSIFTDNVSSAFLSFASRLDELHELFMLERSVDHLPASFAPRASVTIDQIRRLVLKKHIHTLKRLMIKDESKEANWDANEKTMIMICNQGKQLEELAVSTNIHAFHVFMQYFSGLVNLRAINILHFKSNDTCLWVVRETLRNIVDNLSHYPQMRLEWIAMEDDRVDRVVRPNEYDDDDLRRRRDSGSTQHDDLDPFSAPALPPNSGQPSGSGLPIFPSDAIQDDSDSDDELYDSGSRLRYTTVGPMQFYDVWGIKIFEKEIRSGRL